MKSSDVRVQMVLAHLCGEGCHGFGEAAERCERRHDCVVVVTGPTCGRSFALHEDEYDALVRWSEAHGQALACGIRRLDQ
jgi:hypothetical protein